jgi:Kef-type K+ transport system membrane component KefB
MSSTDLAQATVVVDVAAILVTGALLARLSRYVRQPAVVGEIVAGVALGPSLLGLLPHHPDVWLFPPIARPGLGVIAQVGLLLFMFTIGWEFEVDQFRRAKWTVTSITLGSIALPCVAGVGAAVVCFTNTAAGSGVRGGFGTFVLYIAVSMSITAFPVLARILADNGLMADRVGRIVLASAAIGDVVAWCLLAVVVTLVTAGGAGGFIGVVCWSIVYILAMYTIVRPLLRWVSARLTGDTLTTYAAVLVAAGIFLSSYVTSLIGVHPIFGAFAFGLVMPRRSERLEAHVMTPFRSVSRLLLPVYFIVTGLSVNIAGLHGPDFISLAVVLLAACVGKIAGAAVPARLAGIAWRESLAIGTLMNTRGLTELVFLNVGLELGVLDQRMFTVMVLMALVTTAMAGPLLPLLLPQQFGRGTVADPALLAPAGQHVDK